MLLPLPVGLQIDHTCTLLLLARELIEEQLKSPALQLSVLSVLLSMKVDQQASSVRPLTSESDF
jgi:hypothetical protein